MAARYSNRVTASGNDIRRPLVLAAVLLTLLFITPHAALAQPEQEEYVARVERARTLEREINELQDKLARARTDWLALSSRLEDINRRLLDCYAEIDAVEAEVEETRRLLNSKIRYLYTEGNKGDLVKLFSSSDVSEFVTRYSYVLEVADSQARAFRRLREKRERLRSKQEELSDLKEEAARLARDSDAAALEALIYQKRDELAMVNGSIIAEQVPASNSVLPAEFSPRRAYSRPDESAYVRTGQIFSGYATWCGNEFHNRPTASGETYNQYGFTCAHRTLPFGTWLRVTFLGRSVIVRVNDRGPFVTERMLDLSRGAAEAIGLGGVQWVDCELVVPRRPG